jgi:hypothetical protein
MSGLSLPPGHVIILVPAGLRSLQAWACMHACMHACMPYTVYVVTNMVHADAHEEAKSKAHASTDDEGCCAQGTRWC